MHKTRLALAALLATLSLGVHAAAEYPLPQLKFGSADLQNALKRASVEPVWIAQFGTYLGDPPRFWKECVAQEQSIAKKFGGMKPAEAREHARQACQGTVRVYHQCLNNQALNKAVACLQQHINDIAENGE